MRADDYADITVVAPGVYKMAMSPNLDALAWFRVNGSICYNSNFKHKMCEGLTVGTMKRETLPLRK